MNLVLPIIVALALVGLGIWGMRRGVQRGLLTLAWIFFAAILVDLWSPVWADWLREQLKPDNPATLTWIATALSFLVISIVFGFGSGILIRSSNKTAADGLPKKSSVSNGTVGGLLGILSGIVIISYLLRYTTDLLPESDFAVTPASNVVMRLLYEWLPWFLLATLVMFGGIMLFRTVQHFMRAVPQSASKGSEKAQLSSATSPSSSVAGAKSTPEQFDAVNNKINQKLGNKEQR